jgi:hemerythrin-like domain-containing protein
MRDDRRSFLTSVATGLASGAAGLTVLGCARQSPAPTTPGAGSGGEPDRRAGATPQDRSGGHDRDQGKDGDQGKDKDKDEEVTPAEDLMREHGVLRRVMYLYDDAADRLLGCPAVAGAPGAPRHAARDVPLDALAACAGIVRRVIEDYHEKLEEDFLFPRFETAGKLADLTAILRRQHLAGRALTELITQLAHARLADADRARLAGALRSFNHMYRPHAAREDTVLFPALRGLVGAHAYDELGDQFEDKEKQMLGDHGFERAVDEVARLEQAFGLDDLARLTPTA